ncbi:MAG: Gfo/Idh/MocA family protein [Schleiferiaceae bacterium]
MTHTTFAVVGCGRIGQRHIEMIRNLAGAELVATCDLQPADQLGLTGDVPHYADLETLLASHSVDVVAIASPNGVHAQHALASIAAGAHVIVEKPMALRKSDAEHVLYAALQRGRYVFGVMQNRYSPPSEWLKTVVGEGHLGEIYQVHIDCFWNRDDRYYHAGGWHGTKELDGGTLFTQFSHFIDILYWVFGDVKPLSALLRNYNHGHSIEFEDSGLVHFALPQHGAALGSLNYSTSVWDANLESSLTVIGSKGSIKVAGQYMNEVVHCHIEGYEMPVLAPSNPPNDYGPYKGSAANHMYVYENVRDVLNGTQPITTNALEGLKVVEIIESIYALAL